MHTFVTKKKKFKGNLPFTSSSVCIKQLCVLWLWSEIWSFTKSWTDCIVWYLLWIEFESLEFGHGLHVVERFTSVSWRIRTWNKGERVVQWDIQFNSKLELVDMCSSRSLGQTCLNLNLRVCIIILSPAYNQSFVTSQTQCYLLLFLFVFVFFYFEKKQLLFHILFPFTTIIR